MVQCPECTLQKVWKDGMRQTNYGDVQRYLCRNCGFRFSYPPLKESYRWQISRSSSIGSKCQIGATRQAHGLVKNLAKVEEPLKERPAGATTPDQQTVKGIITKYAYWLEKEGYKSTEYIDIIKRLTRLGANLLDPESIKKTVAQQNWKDGTKMLAIYAYDNLAKMLNIQWTPPKYTQEENLPFIPQETELDQLIAACRSQRMATFLQTLKEAFADPAKS